MHPFAGQRGTEIHAVVRGSNLKGTSSVFIKQTGLQVSVESGGVESTPANPSKPLDTVRLRITSTSATRQGATRCAS